jgi:predicted AlkP superfamily pyrophosphatase or phosphodiesterase
MKRLRNALAGLVLGAGIILASGASAAPGGHPVLMISIDGLRPGDVIHAEQRGMKLPNLRRFLADGAYATGVTGVLPTLTYPSHTTLITGTAPAQHGVLSNTTFDPANINTDGWYWYSSDIHVRTLWQAAHAAGLSTGNVHWPVSVGAQGLDWNLPQIWRTGHEDDVKLLTALATPGLPAALEKGDHYAQGKDESLEGDANRTAYAARLIALHHPGFLTVYLAGLDHVEHASGPDTPEARAALERLDADVGVLVAAEQAALPQAVIALVSDHGFAKVDMAFNLSRALIDAGLLHVGPVGPMGGIAITGWEAAAWASGGSVAVVLAHPEDAALRAKVAALLERLKADPANRITRIITQPAIAGQGGNPQAAFYLDLGPGMMAFPYLSPTLPLVGPTPYKGMHGYFPGNHDMDATFMLMGPGVPHGRDMGQIDMRAIAPTLARIMGASLPEAQAKPLDF